MAVAYAVAVPILKLRGFVLAMGSLALHLILIVFAFELPAFTGGALGTYGVQRFAIFGATLTTDLGYYFVVWAVVLVFVAIGLNIDRSLRRPRTQGHRRQRNGGRLGRHRHRQAQGPDVRARRRHGERVGQPVRALPARDGSDRVRLRLQPQPDHRRHHRRIDVDLGRRRSARGSDGLREALRGFSLPMWESVIMGALTAIVLIAFPRGVAGFIGKAFARLSGADRAVRPSLAEPAATRCRPARTRPRRASRCCR